MQNTHLGGGGLLKGGGGLRLGCGKGEKASPPIIFGGGELARDIKEGGLLGEESGGDSMANGGGATTEDSVIVMGPNSEHAFTSAKCKSVGFKPFFCLTTSI